MGVAKKKPGTEKVLVGTRAIARLRKTPANFVRRLGVFFYFFIFLFFYFRRALRCAGPYTEPSAALGFVIPEEAFSLSYIFERGVVMSSSL